MNNKQVEDKNSEVREEYKEEKSKERKSVEGLSNYRRLTFQIPHY